MNLNNGQNDRVFMQNDQPFHRYWVPSPEIIKWGIYVFNVGHSQCPRNKPYPPETHPRDHHIEWKNGRILSSPAILYITRGSGTFHSKPSGTLQIKAGDVLFLAPEVRHRYRPTPKIGWEEYWVEFDGVNARHLLRGKEFSEKSPRLCSINDDELKHLFKSILLLAKEEIGGFEYLMAADVVKIIALLIQKISYSDSTSKTAPQAIFEARDVLKSSPDASLKKLAEKHHLSYSHFRRLFKKHTGFSPRQYAIEQRLQHSKHLLRNSSLTINEISDKLGFETCYYFSQLFKRKTGTSPNQFRTLAKV